MRIFNKKHAIVDANVNRHHRCTDKNNFIFYLMHSVVYSLHCKEQSRPRNTVMLLLNFTYSIFALVM